jgi:His-Xaa-Ser system radical SAM maturase HxsB
LHSTSPSIAFELQGQGGEPLLNFDVLRHVVEFAQARSKRSAGKALSFRLLSNFTGMSEEAAEWLIANDVLVSTSLDGPASVHDWNRKWKGGSAHAEVVGWIDYFHRRYAELGRDPKQWHVDALMTATRRTLEAGRDVVDEYVARGMRTIQLRPLDCSRVDRDAWATIGYSAEEYLDFYRRTLDYILELNRQGVEISERTASVFLMKILGSDDRGGVDVQSPYSAGTGQIAYDVDGRVFPDDEARMVDATGDPIFELGHVRDLTIPDVVGHPTVRAIAAASLLDAQPMCADCWNKPFCGFSPVRNFATQGDLFGQRPRCLECKEHMAVSTKLFELLADESDAGTARILRGWTATRPAHAIDARALTAAP